MLTDFTSKLTGAATLSSVRQRMTNSCARTCLLRDSILEKGKIKLLIRITLNNNVSRFSNCDIIGMLNENYIISWMLNNGGKSQSLFHHPR